MNIVRDIINPGLTILFIGFNPGMRSAETGHHFAGPSNRFWRLLADSGLTPYRLQPNNDGDLLAFGYGITNIVARPTRAAAEIKKEEYEQGRLILQQKLEVYKPQIACYTGIGVYKQFAQCASVDCGIQTSSVVPGIIDFVVSSPSGLNRIPLPHQLKHYQELRHLATTRPVKQTD